MRSPYRHAHFSLSSVFLSFAMACFPPFGFVFCDFLTVTFPCGEWLELRPALEAVLDEVSCESPQDGVYLRYGGGWVKCGRRSGVMWVQTSGEVLGALRDVGAYSAYLKVFAGLPHNVTRLDASLDLVEDAPPVIDRLYSLASGGAVSLSRKTVRPSGVCAYISPGLADGRHTGTLYVGSRSSEIRLVVYDKREEVLKKAREDIGPRLRYELRVTAKMGASLRDAWEPAAMFYHFLSPGILQAPEGVQEWVPYREGGFAVDRPEILPYARLKRRVEDSHELARLVALADDCGPRGRELLCGLLGRFHGLAGPFTPSLDN